MCTGIHMHRCIVKMCRLIGTHMNRYTVTTMYTDVCMCTVTLYIGTMVGRYTALCVHKHRGVWVYIVYTCVHSYAHGYIGR